MLHDDDFVTLWIHVRPNKLFRGFCLVVCVIYNPLTNDKNEFMKQLSTKLDIALTKYPNTKVVLVGDFKQVSIFSLM